MTVTHPAETQPTPRVMGRPCQVGRCRRWDATRCGTVYACPDCRAQIERMTAIYQAEGATA